MEFPQCRELISWTILPPSHSFFAVNAATNERDPLKRIAYVAAFAMSNYSSTIGRIAKPFNPMLVSRRFSSVRSNNVDIQNSGRDIRVCSAGATIQICLRTSQPPSADICLLGRIPLLEVLWRGKCCGAFHHSSLKLMIILG